MRELSKTQSKANAFQTVVDQDQARRWSRKRDSLASWFACHLASPFIRCLETKGGEDFSAQPPRVPPLEGHNEDKAWTWLLQTRSGMATRRGVFTIAAWSAEFYGRITSLQILPCDHRGPEGQESYRPATFSHQTAATLDHRQTMRVMPKPIVHRFVNPSNFIYQSSFLTCTPPLVKKSTQ